MTSAFEIGHSTPRLQMAELRPQRSQQRGWTPPALAQALAKQGISLSERTLRRECERGTIPCTTTAGGHRRIDPAWVDTNFPSVAR